MKKIFLALLLVVFSAVIIACTPSETNNGAIYDFSELRGEKETITVWIDDQDGEYMQAVIEAFNATDAGKNIIVKHQHMGSVEAREKLKTYGLTGNGADIFQFPHDHLATAVLEDLVYPIPAGTASKVAERAHPLGLDIATLLYNEETGEFGPGANATEQLYAVPMSLEAVGLYYNKALVSTPATTYEEILTAGTTWNAAEASDGSGLTNAAKGYYYLGTSSHWADSYFIQHIYSSFGFQPFGPELNNPNNVGFAQAESALTWMVNSLKPVVTGNGNHNSVTANANFVAGKIPYIIAGPWNIQEYKDSTTLGDFGIAPLPSINGQVGKPFAGAQMLAIYKYSKHTAAASAFLEFMLSDEAMQLQFDMKYKVPALKTELLPNIDGFMNDDLMVAISEQLNDAIPMPTIPEVQHYWGPGESMVISVWNTGTAPSDAVAAAEIAYQALRNLGA